MNKKLFWISISIYVLITFIRIMHHQTWNDEARAWLIAENLNLFEIFNLMKTEGHTFIWYVLLMPFAKTHFFYPYSMLILNWLFCLAAIVVMWFYAPFNSILKIFITFSTPFFIVYPLLARCYSVGIFLLFVLAAMFKGKLKHPYLYSCLIFLCANTSVMAAVGAISFAVLFLYDLIKVKEYKIILRCSFIALACGIILLLQLYGANPVKALPEMLIGINLNFFSNVFIFPTFVNFFLLLLFVPTILFLMLKQKYAFSFLCLSYLLLFMIFHFVYLGLAWHHYFLYIYLLIASWIYLTDEFVSIKIKSILSILLIIISFLYCVDFRYRRGAFNSGSKILAQKVISYKDSGIIFVGKNFFQLLPYIEDKNVDYYYAHTFNKIKNPIKAENSIPKKIDFDAVSKIYDIHSHTYLFLLEKDISKQLSDFEMVNGKTVLKFKLLEIFGKNVYIYEVVKN